MNAYSALLIPDATPEHPAILELTTPAPRRPSGLRIGLAVVTASLVVALCVLAFATAAGWLDTPASTGSARLSVAIGTAPIDPDRFLTSDPADLRPVSRDEAVAINAGIPLRGAGNVPALPLAVPMANVGSYMRAVDCMAAAIYYEARAEPLDGQRAVAQVILNRVRHPAYPATVCGVVFQGAERRTGCQFSFTCDGSLYNPPTPAGWAAARAVAVAALGGQVYAPVGLATHYHADYVVPYWASEMLKSLVVGRHIFYRFNGSWGRMPAYRAPYAGNEPDLMQRGAAGRIVAVMSPLTVDGAPQMAAPSARPALANDGTLLTAGDPALPAGARPLMDKAAPAAHTVPLVPATPRWVISMKPAATPEDAGR